MSRAHVQIWDAPQCQTGASAKGPLTQWQTARVTESEGNPPQLVFTGVSQHELLAASASDGHVLRILTKRRGVQWWVITDISDSDGTGSGLATVTCGPLILLLGLRGLVRDGGTYRFTPSPELRAIDHLREYLLSTSATTLVARAELAADGLDWISIGTSDFPAPLALPAFAKQTRLGVGRSVEGLTGGTLVLRPLVPDGSTGFALDLVRDPSAGQPLALYTVGKNVITAARSRNVLRSPSVLTPFGADDQTLDVTEWDVHGVTGAGPYWVTLRDPDSTAPWPIREDAQFVGAYLLQADGTTHAITDSRESDSSVLVASSTGLTVGSRVGLVRTTLGEPLREIASPSMLLNRKRVHAPLNQPGVHFARNRTRDGLLQAWTDPVTPTHWSLIGGCHVVRYRRVENITAWSGAANGAYPIGATVITIQGANPDSRLYGSEVVSFAATGQNRALAGGVVQIDGTGAGVITLATALTTAILDSAVINGTYVLATAQSFPKRPSWLAMPRNGDPQWALRFRSNASSTTMPPPVGQDRVQSPAIRVLYTNSSRDRVRCAAGFTVTNGQQVTGQNYGNRLAGVVTEDPTAADERRLPGVMLVGDPAGTPVRLAFGVMGPSVPAGAVVNDTATCEHTITANTTVALALLPHADVNRFAITRWATLWVGDEDEPPIGDGSRSNAPFHAAQDVLESVRGATRFRLTGVDLDALLAEGSPPALNQRVRFRSSRLGVDAMVRLISITWSLSNDQTFDAETGTPQPRISSVTVSL